MGYGVSWPCRGVKTHTLDLLRSTRPAPPIRTTPSVLFLSLWFSVFCDSGPPPLTLYLLLVHFNELSHEFKGWYIVSKSSGCLEGREFALCLICDCWKWKMSTSRKRKIIEQGAESSMGHLKGCLAMLLRDKGKKIVLTVLWQSWNFYLDAYRESQKSWSETGIIPGFDKVLRGCDSPMRSLKQAALSLDIA